MLIAPPNGACSDVAEIDVMSGHWSIRPVIATEPRVLVRVHCKRTLASAVWPATTVNGAEPEQVCPSLDDAIIATL